MRVKLDSLPGLHEQRSELLGWLLQMKCVMDKDYIPNFKTAFEHFLVHTGGRAVIEEVEKKLCLDPADVQPSKETLYRYGNTCCAAVFYVLTNMESRVSSRPPRPHMQMPSESRYGTAYAHFAAIWSSMRAYVVDHPHVMVLWDSQQLCLSSFLTYLKLPH